MAASAGTIWFWMDSGGAPAATSLIHDSRRFVHMLVRCLALLI
jgi:hypothetical protein